MERGQTAVAREPASSRWCWSQIRHLVDGAETGASAVHGDVPVGQADQIVLGHRLDDAARGGHVAHAQVLIADAELLAVQSQVLAAGSIVAVLVRTVEDLRHVLQVAAVLLNGGYQQLGGNVLAVLVRAEGVTAGWYLEPAARQEEVVDGLATQTGRVGRARLGHTALRRQVLVGHLGHRVRGVESAIVASSNTSSDALVDALESLGAWLDSHGPFGFGLDDLGVEGVVDGVVNDGVTSFDFRRGLIEQLQLVRALGLDVLDAAGQALLYDSFRAAQHFGDAVAGGHLHLAEGYGTGGDEQE
ncbi:hypothetical protein PENTCL1PPCAC_24664 [Pristionchus entomophagus]|uniref:Ribosomal protein n=1 Tax=Pristionchus entomophagus TaxID=358040 RepID=A0AAV5U8G7_9BILA|nr:hypothetical protein PENTCL1PPCAC_24664 [Pristionchus entomophagus]